MSDNLPKVWAFKNPTGAELCQEVYESVKAGKSRFGWSTEDRHSLHIKEPWSEWHSRQQFLLHISPKDWIVHINVPTYGMCVAAQVTGTYDFDEGVLGDCRHYIPVDPESVRKFSRRDPNILMEVNLRPRGRYHRVYAVPEFFESLDNLKTGKYKPEKGETANELQLKEKGLNKLQEIVDIIQTTHPNKHLELFMVEVLKQVPDVENVDPNGFGWKTDHGADIIVDFKSPLGFEYKVIVQVKSYTGTHGGTAGVNDLRRGIEEFKGNAGLLISTARETEKLNEALEKLSKDIDKPISSLCGIDLARFVLKHAPHLVLGD